MLKSLFVEFLQLGLGSVRRSAQEKMRDIVSVKDFGASESASAAQNTAAFNAAKVAGVPLVPAGTYAISGSVTGTFYSFGGVTITGGTVADLVNLSSQRQACPIPSGQFDDMFLPSDFAMRLEDTGSDDRAYGYANYTAEQLFDLRSTARSAPTNTYWVDPVSGNDSTGDGAAEGTAWQTLGKAISTGSAAGSPFKVKLKGGGAVSQDMIKTKNFTNASSSSIYDSVVDFCVEFYNGVSVVGSHVDFSAPSLHSSATYTYAIADTSTDVILDRTLLDVDGVAQRMQYVPYVASGDIPPGCWSANGTTTIVRRLDGAAVTNANTRLIQSVRNFKLTKNISVGLFPATAADVLIVEGGGAMNGTIDMTIPTSETDLTVRCFAAKNVRANSHSFLASGAGRCFSIDGLHGLIVLENCGGQQAKSDLINVHNVRGGTVAGVKSRLLTINCRGSKSGVDIRASGGSNTVSNNLWTLHEDSKGIDLAGDYEFASGGCVRDINSTSALLLGTRLHDRGDRYLGSTTQPCGIHVNNTASVWAWRVRMPNMPPGSFAYFNANSGAAHIYLRDCWPTKAASSGTIETW